MGELINENVKDPKLREWIIPDFTTTTDEDKVTAGAIMMGAMQQYFEYVFDCTTCGIPSVTLLGVRQDWENILERLDKLQQLGDEPKQFGELLKAVLNGFLMTFDDPNDPSTRQFWSKIAREDSGSGYDDLSGWITAFVFWDEEGKCLYPMGSRLPPAACLDTYATCGAKFHIVDMQKIPPAHVSMPVLVKDDFGDYPCMLVAGSVGCQIQSSGKPIASAEARPQGPEERDVKAEAKVETETASTLTNSTASSASSRGREYLKKLQSRVLRKKPSPEKPTPQESKIMTAEGFDPFGQVEGETGLDSLQPASGWWLFEKKDEPKASEGDRELEPHTDTDKKDVAIPVPIEESESSASREAVLRMWGRAAALARA